MAGLAGRSHGIAVSNGSVALDAAVAALKLGPGDGVLMPAFTIISCAAAVVRAGAVPLLVDCDPLTFNMDVGKLRDRLEAALRGPGPRPKAILVAHIYGLPTDMDPVMELAREHGLKVIEDAALAERCLLAQPLLRPRAALHPPGDGLEPAHVQHPGRRRGGPARAARRLRRQEAPYREDLRPPARRHPRPPPPGRAHGLRREYLLGLRGHARRRRALRRRGGGQAPGARKIGTRHFFWPMHLQPVFRDMGLFGGESHPVSERIARRGFYLPSGLALTDAQMEETAAAVMEILA